MFSILELGCTAVATEAVSRATSFVTGKYKEHNNVQEWIDRLVMAQIEIESALLISEEFDINYEPLHQWQEKLKEAACEAKEALSNFQAEILHEEPNQTIEGGSSARDQSVHEEGSDDATLVHPATNIREAAAHQVNLEENLPHDQSVHEEGSDFATLSHPASNFREAVAHRVNLEENLPHDQSVHEEGSDDATLSHPASNFREVVAHQVNLEENLPHNQSVHEEGSDDATLSQPASNFREAVTHQVNLEENLPHDQSMHEEGSDYATLSHPASNFREAGTRQVDLEANIPHDPPMQEDVFDNEKFQETVREVARAVAKCILMYVIRLFKCRRTDSPWPALIERLSAFSRLLDPRTFSLLDPRTMVVKYLENDEKVSKLIKTVEKLEKMAGEIGVFIELLKLQLKRKMCRKRKRSGVALQAFFLVLPLKLQTYALFFYGEDPYLLVIMLFRAICYATTGITGDIFIGLIM